MQLSSHSRGVARPFGAARGAAPGRRAALPGRRGAAVAAGGLSGCKLVGVGSSVPSTVLTNADLTQFVDTNDEWIESRTGIKQRRILGPGETLTQHAAAAGLRALEMAGIAPGDVDLVLVATSTPDDVFGTACGVQAAIGAKNAVAFDITAACSGFVLALVTAAQYVRCGTFRRVLIVGADAMSRLVDWRDRSTCILFGDGCGAVVMTASADGSCSLLGVDMHSDGAGGKSLNCLYTGPGAKPFAEGGAASAAASYANVAMNGQEVFKFAVRSVPTVIEAAIERAGLTKGDVDWLVMHQANKRIIDAAAERLGLPPDRVVTNLERYGNTSAASVPLALDEAVRGGRIQPGDVIAMAGFGAGLTWASAIVRWN